MRLSTWYHANKPMSKKEKPAMSCDIAGSVYDRRSDDCPNFVGNPFSEAVLHDFFDLEFDRLMGSE